MEPDSAANYDSSQIKVLKGLDAVRKRPGMYIGDTDDGTGLHHLVFEVVDNSVDEALAGHCSKIDVTIHADDAITVADNGRGIPVDIHPEENRSAAEVIMTVLHAGGKFDDNAYKVSGGLHGVGVSVVNALSEGLTLTIDKNGKRHQQKYQLGVAQAPLQIIADTDKTGTSVHFKPCANIFATTEFHYEVLASRLRELAFLNAGINISLKDERSGAEETFFYEGGIRDFIVYLNTNKTAVNPTIFQASMRQDKIKVSFALQWQDGYQDNIHCFTNTIRQKDGGTHSSGFRGALTRCINRYIEQNTTKGKVQLVQGEDTREGLTAAISVEMFEPRFSSQTKDKLVSSEIKPIVESAFGNAFFDFLQENPAEAKKIIAKVQEACQARDAARKAREVSRRKNALELSNLPGKLADCSNSEDVEVFIVEGESAGGSAKSGRDRATQAILPLKGKIINVEKARFDKMLANEEILVLIKALGCGIGNEAYDPSKLRYERIIIMTDADIDGAHIRTLLLTFFYRQMPELIERGHIFIAQPPLYKVTYRKQSQHLKDDLALDQYLVSTSLNEVSYKIDPDSPPITAINLEKLCEDHWKLSPIIDRLSHYHPKHLIYALLMHSGLNGSQLKDKSELEKWTEGLETITQKLTRDERDDYHYEIAKTEDEDGENYYPVLVQQSASKKHQQRHALVPSFFSADDYKALIECSNSHQHHFSAQSTLESNEISYPVHNLPELIDTMKKIARSKISIQRFKGLGEMNPEQLWETTMDPEQRFLTKVKIDDAISADAIFSVLMGDQVQPRKDFIETHSHLAENIDT